MCFSSSMKLGLGLYVNRLMREPYIDSHRKKKCNFDPDWDFQPWSLTGLISTTLEHATRIGGGLKILQCETGWTKSPVWNRFRPRYFGQCEQAVVEFKIQTLIKNTTKLPQPWSLLLYNFWCFHSSSKDSSANNYLIKRKLFVFNSNSFGSQI